MYTNFAIVEAMILTEATFYALEQMGITSKEEKDRFVKAFNSKLSELVSKHSN